MGGTRTTEFAGRPRLSSRPDLDGGARLRRTHLEKPAQRVEEWRRGHAGDRRLAAVFGCSGRWLRWGSLSGAGTEGEGNALPSVAVRCAARQVQHHAPAGDDDGGANAILALRCCILSGRFESFWERRNAAA